MKLKTKLNMAVAAIALVAGTMTTPTASFASENEPWSKTDKALFAGLTALRAVDMAQTMSIAANPEKYHEATNLFLGSHPSRGKVAGFFILSHGLIWLATDYMSPKARKIFLSGGIAIEAAFVGHNASLGITVKF